MMTAAFIGGPLRRRDVARIIVTYAAPIQRSSRPATALQRTAGVTLRYFGTDRTIPLAALRKNSAWGLNAGWRTLT